MSAKSLQINKQHKQAKKPELSWLSYLTFLSIDFLTCKLRIKTTLRAVRIEWAYLSEFVCVSVCVRVCVN